MECFVEIPKKTTRRIPFRKLRVHAYFASSLLEVG